MLPKNSMHFIKPTADRLDCSVQLVDDVVSFFYSDVRRSLTEMEGPNIQIENLGAFKAKPKELPKLVAKLTKNLEVLKPETFNQMTMQKNLTLKLKRVTGLQKMILKEKVRKAEFMQIKHEQRKAKQNMEQPDSNS